MTIYVSEDGEIAECGYHAEGGFYCYSPTVDRGAYVSFAELPAAVVVALAAVKDAELLRGEYDERAARELWSRTREEIAGAVQQVNVRRGDAHATWDIYRAAMAGAVERRFGSVERVERASVLTILTLEDCFNYLSGQWLELRCGYTEKKWWARLVRTTDGEEVASTGHASSLSAIKGAISAWESR